MVKNTQKILVGFFLIAFMLSLVAAVGVSTPYWSTNPLKLQPGESTTITLALQNMVGDQNITLRANISKGNDIASISDESGDYLVPIGRNDIEMNILVNLPENVPIGQTQDVEVSFVQVTGDNEGGFFTVTSAFTQRIPVLVVGDATESVTFGQKQSIFTPLTWGILAVLIAIIVVSIMIRKKN